MENYKLVNSREVREKAERLGYDLNKDFVDDPFIILYADGKTLKFGNVIDYANCSMKEITQADFLALPEPFKVGDWVKVNCGTDHKRLIKVGIILNERLSTGVYGDSYNIKCCTKLTPEQIKVLGLEG